MFTIVFLHINIIIIIMNFIITTIQTKQQIFHFLFFLLFKLFKTEWKILPEFLFYFVLSKEYSGAHPQFHLKK